MDGNYLLVVISEELPDAVTLEGIVWWHDFFGLTRLCYVYKISFSSSTVSYCESVFREHSNRTNDIDTVGYVWST